MTDIDPQSQRLFAIEVVRDLRAKGYQAFWAGGCVRDQLLGRAPKDYDVATSAKPDEVRQLFGKRRTIPVGASFGVITVLGPSKDAGQIEVATFRQDAGYSDGRRPDAVQFSTAEADAQRRDFTINGLFFDPVTNEVIDYVGGQQDLSTRLLRAIGNPAERIAEDKLRMLRAVRFAAKFDFEIDPATRLAIQAMASQITIVSAERIAAEMRLMLEHPSRARAIELLDELSLLSVILPEVRSSQIDDWRETLTNLRAFDFEASFPLALAVLLHRYAGPTETVAIGQRWKLANREIERTRWLLAHQSGLLSAPAQPWPQLQRLLIEPGIGELVALHAVLHRNSPTLAADRAFCLEKLSLPKAELDPPPLITGDDLKAHGIPPGKIYQEILERIRDAQLLGRIDTKEAALALVAQLGLE